MQRTHVLGQRHQDLIHAVAERIARDPDASALFAPDSELVTRLRSELLDLSLRAKDIEGRVGNNGWPVLVTRGPLNSAPVPVRMTTLVS